MFASFKRIVRDIIAEKYVSISFCIRGESSWRR